ncbi:UNVERIFIED_CONTAM: ActR/RegA family two-component response regulator [Paenibacillus sp. PvR008]
MNDYISKPVKISSVKQALLQHSPDHFPMQPGKDQIHEA